MAESGTTFSYARLEIAKDQKQSRLLKLLPSLARLAIAKEKKQNRLLKLLPSLARLAIKEQKQIRLLKLLPSLDTDQISCTLEVVNWTPELQYAAISYVWGDPRIKKGIYINDQPFRITENLYTALWYIRKNHMLRQDGSEQPLPLWADAICINQDNIEERNHQVALMGSIYGSASKVIYWLGREDDNRSEDEAITAIQEMAEAAFHDSSVLDTDSLKKFLATHKDLTVPNTSNDDDETFSNVPPLWQSILRILNHAFWERIWIIQEIALPVSQDGLHLTCGDSTVTWTRFLQFFQIVDVIREPGGDSLGLSELVNSRLSIMFNSGVPHVLALRQFRDRDVHLGPGNLPIFAAIYRATNPLDYVYGFRAVLHILPAVNYKRSKKEVYMDWFKDAMQHSTVFQLLAFAGIWFHRPANQDWPSWLPDLASIRDGRLYLSSKISVRDKLDAQKFSEDTDGKVLHIYGVRLVDSVAKVFKPEPGAPKKPNGFMVEFVHYTCFSILANASNHPLGVTPLQAFLITVVNCFKGITNSRISFEHPLDTNDPLLVAMIICIIYNNPCTHLESSHDDYVSTYGPGWVSMGLRDGDDLENHLQKQFVGDLTPDELLRFEPTSVHSQGLSMLTVRLQQYATFQTTNGHIGIGPPGVTEGDELCFFGHASPMLLRLEKENDSMVTKFVGKCYVHESSVSVMKDSAASRGAKVEKISLH